MIEFLCHKCKKSGKLLDSNKENPTTDAISSWKDTL
jgi:hypothetical protein